MVKMLAFPRAPPARARLLKSNLNKGIMNSMTLDEVALEVRVRIVDFVSVGETERARLSGLGLRPGVSVVKLVPTPLRDPVECLVGSQLLALDRSLLARIQVEAAGA
jgi:Fe2+ transport system protein FeoA